MVRTNRTLTSKQQHVLNVFADGSAYSLSDWAAWYPMHSDQARSIARSLFNRGLVDVAGFDGRSRTYSITDAGAEALEACAAQREP